LQALPSWPLRGVRGKNDEYAHIAECVLRADTRHHLTNGFFVAVFERRTPLQSPTQMTKRVAIRKVSNISVPKKKRKNC
jgi:hypothetical protein